MGQGRGGLYSYEFLENLAGCAMSNADRVHPELQDLKVGDPIRFVPQPYLGFVEAPFWKVSVVEPRRALVVPGLGSFVLEPVAGDRHATRLLMRMSSSGGADPMDAIALVMGRRMVLGIQERAEGNPLPAWIDALEIATWVVAFAVSVAAGLWVLRRREWPQFTALLVGAIAVLFFLIFWRPLLPISVVLDVALLGAVWWVQARVSAASLFTTRAARRWAESLGTQSR